ncbi:YbhB/YbcL family Raf kinase inhibitor-like protein [Bradyrhizobium manausense]
MNKYLRAPIVGVLLLSATGVTAASSFEVASEDGKTGKLGPDHFATVMGCMGQNISPQIAWSGEPEGTKSFAVSIYDQDAPTGSGWWHWSVINIPASVHELGRGAGSDPSILPAGALQTNTDAGVPRYGGPCPPSGTTHRYTITVKALKIDKLEVSPNATGALIGLRTNMNSIGEARLVLTGTR